MLPCEQVKILARFEDHTEFFLYQYKELKRIAISLWIITSATS
jgi:hypothetical protein